MFVLSKDTTQSNLLGSSSNPQSAFNGLALAAESDGYPVNDNNFIAIFEANARRPEGPDTAGDRGPIYADPWQTAIFTVDTASGVLNIVYFGSNGTSVPMQGCVFTGPALYIGVCKNVSLLDTGYTQTQVIYKLISAN